MEKMGGVYFSLFHSLSLSYQGTYVVTTSNGVIKRHVIWH